MVIIRESERRDGIGCPQQISFLKLWERSRGQNSLPSIDVLNVENLRPIADKLMLCQVSREGEDLRFLIKFHGKQYEVAHGRNCVGRSVEDAIAPSLREKALFMYRQVAVSGEPLFSSTPMRDGDGPIVHYERLLVPFTKTGLVVDYICCIITMITEENGFDFNIAMKGHPVHEKT